MDKDLKDELALLDIEDIKVLTKTRREAQQAVYENPTEENVKRLTVIKKALKEALLFLGEYEASIFSNISDVVAYLQSQGWKISDPTIYRHKQQGKLKPNSSGMYPLDEVANYATKYLKRLDGANTSEELEELQKRKIEAETRRSAARARYWDERTKQESGKYIEKEIFARALAKRALFFRSDLENFFHAETANLVHMAKGDDEMIPDIIEYMLQKLDQFLDRYAKNPEIIA